MYPNQQPSQPPQAPPPSNSGGYGPQPGYPQPQPAPQYGQPQQAPQQPYQPQPPTNYAPQPGATPAPGQEYGQQPAQAYAVDYLDQIAPPPARQPFMSGFFGKAVIILGIIFVLAVSLIVAFGNQKRTADLENMAIRLDNMKMTAKNTHKDLKNGKLLATNSNYQIWIANANRDAYQLLTQAEVKKTSMDKKMIAGETTARKELEEKFTDAKLNANLDRVYAREMAYQTQLMVTAYTKMSKTSEAKAIREYAKTSADNLTPIQKSFADFDDNAS